RIRSIVAQARDLIGRIDSGITARVLPTSHFMLPSVVATPREPLESDFERLRTLARVSQAMTSSLDTGRVLKAIASAAATLMGAPLATFWLVDEVARTMRACAFSDEALAADLL